MKKGQICRGSSLGEKIYTFSKREDIHTIVEIGTWLGLGSTKCILDGVLSKKTDTMIYSLECNEERHYQAGINLGKLPENFYLVHGTIVSVKELQHIMKTIHQPIHQQWLAEDIEAVETAPNVFDKLPERIDLCVMDGGGFSGMLEFRKLWKRCRFIILDDTNMNKHKETKRFVLNNPDKFNVIEDNILERNGFLICEVIKEKK